MSDHAIALEDIRADRLRDVAYSAEIDLDGETKKEAVIEQLREANVEFGSDGWTKDGEPFEVQERTNPPSDEVIIYGFRRAAADEHLDDIEALFEETDYELRLGKPRAAKKPRNS